MQKMLLDEMTWREAQAYLKRSDVAFLPTGTIEGHGPHVPMGCDSYVATAVSILLARKVDGVVLPPMMYNYTGATTSFRGTITVSIPTQVAMLKDIVRSLWRNGFRRIFIVSVHGPNGMPVGQTVRELFEEDRIPAVYLNPWTHVDREELSRRIPNFDGPYLEAMLAYASMRMLGKEHAIPDVEVLEDRYAPKREPEALGKLQAFGTVGYHYTDELQHIPPRGGIDVDLGMEVLEQLAEKLAPAVDHLKAYVEYLEAHPWAYVE